MEKKDLFSPLQLGDLRLKNRIFMAPMTRTRVDANDVLSPMAVTYYTQRAAAGLIISEAAYIAPGGKVRALQPGIFTQDQLEAWKKVTTAVHANNGHIFAQLAHSGRSAIPEYNGGVYPVAPSALAFDGGAHGTIEGKEQQPLIPRECTPDDIKALVLKYRKAAENAQQAGFDGVELHACNAGLVEQFLHPVSNIRTDEYGGSLENRARFLLEVIDELIAVYSKERVGIKLSPHDRLSDQKDPDPVATTTYLAQELNRRGIAYIDLLEPLDKFDPFIPYPEGDPETLDIVRKHFKGMLIANGGYDKDSGNEAIATETVDAVAYSRLFLANPDLPYRLKHDLPLNEPDRNTFYGNTEKGYLDYPFWNTSNTAVLK
jgi:N-ethylmaleimide reductase